MKTHLKPTTNVLGGVGITDENTSFLVGGKLCLNCFHFF
jgi:hypothetical protein